MDNETEVPFKNYFPNLSLSSFFWVIIGLSGLFFVVVGYFVGVRVNELPSSNQPSQSPSVSPFLQPTLQPGDDNDIDYSSINGTILVNTNYYDQFVVRVNGLPSSTSTMIDTDYRTFTNPHVGIQYPYFFSRLNPSRSYEVSASACRVNDTTHAFECAQNIRITKCTGKLQGKTCLIPGNGIESQSSGEVDFALGKTASDSSGSAGQ
jgi:hypothetical protein